MLYFLLMVIFGYFGLGCLANEDNGYVLKLEHAFGEGNFYERGELFFPSIRGERTVAQKQKSLSQQEYSLLEELSNNDGIYKIRVKSKLTPYTTNADDDLIWLSSFTYAKLLKDANLSDQITIHTDGIGNLLAINLFPSPSKVELNANALEFKTNVSVVLPGVAAGPDTSGYLNKLDEERRKKEAAAKEPTSFFSKYWMYIIPVVLFMMLQNAAQQQQQ